LRFANWTFGPEQLDNLCDGIQREERETNQPEERLMEMRGSVLLLATCAMLPITGAEGQAPQATQLYTLDGTVRHGNDPVESAELALSRGNQAARLFRTGADGKFSFPDLTPGPVVLKVRRLGYKAEMMNVNVGSQTAARPLDVQLGEIVSTVEEVIVEGSKGHLQEFYDHKANNNFAKFFERKDIEERNPTYMSELLRTVTGAKISSRGAGNAILLRGCQPMVWVNGMRSPGAELDDVVRPIDVAAMEVFPSSAGLPPQYQDRNNRMCGAIMIWTRNQ
jgi:hypothetical protein